jgi:hypothetical protein
MVEKEVPELISTMNYFSGSKHDEWYEKSNGAMNNLLTPLFDDLERLRDQFFQYNVSASAANMIGMQRGYNGLYAINPTAPRIRPPLIELLARSCIDVPSNVTEDKDRVFSMLGLASDANSLEIVPDYNRSVTF